MIRTILRSDIVKAVPDGWTRQYSNCKGPLWERHHRVSDELQALKEGDFTADQVDQIIGNKSWTRLCCDECGQESDALCSIGSDEMGDPSGNYCARCFREALYQLDALT